MQTTKTRFQDYAQPSIWARHLALGKFVLTLSVKCDAEQEPARDQFANRLAALRRERGLSRAEVADSLHIHLSTLAAMEDGSYLPSLPLAIRLSELFVLPIEAIFFSPTTERSA